MERVNIIGGGLAGVEAAHQLILRQIPVRLYEMRPHQTTDTRSRVRIFCGTGLF